MDIESLTTGADLGALMFRNNPDLVVLLRVRDDGTLEVVRGNDVLLEATGWTQADVEGLPVADLVPPDVAQTVQDALAEMSSVGEHRRFEIATEVPAGRRVYDVTMIEVEPVDGHRQLVQITHDITEAHRNAAALSETQAIAHIGHWMWDLTTNELLATAELLRIYGMPEIEGAVDVELFWARVVPEDAQPLRETIEAAVEALGAFESEYEVLGSNDQRRLVLTKGRTICDAGGAPIRLSGTVQDITEQRVVELTARGAELVAQQQRQALELNDDVVQGLATVRLALMAGDQDQALATLDATTASARSIISHLLAATVNRGISAGDLVRERSASMSDRSDRS